MTDNLLGLSVGIVTAYLSHNQVPMAEVPAAMRRIHEAIVGLSSGDAPRERQEPAVPIKRSVMDDHIVCLEDGAKLKSMRRYLRGRYDLSPEQYRAKWGLPYDYPMIAPAYARMRSDFAKKIGLGKLPPGVARKTKPKRK